MSPDKDNIKLALSLAMLIVGMLLLTYASVPLYNIFCKLTGYGGTTQQAKIVSHTRGVKKIKVTFDSNIDSFLPWIFKPEQKSVELTVGENALIFYSATNLSNQPTMGTAVYNVTPHKAGLYFNKIQCFCFEEQLLQPNQSIMMPVSFFIDPEIEKDKDLENLQEITLSYTFYGLEK
jgi:cytochrome c oxidase assembly protein subunit 11